MLMAFGSLLVLSVISTTTASVRAFPKTPRPFLLASASLAAGAAPVAVAAPPLTMAAAFALIVLAALAAISSYSSSVFTVLNLSGRFPLRAR